MFVKTQDMDRSVVTVKTYSKISYQKKITPRIFERWVSMGKKISLYIQFLNPKTIFFWKPVFDN